MPDARIAAAATSVITWLGLALMSASFIALLLISPSPSSKPLSSRDQRDPVPLVVIDPGHGGQDSGAISGNVLEKDLTLDIARRVERSLAAHKIATLLTRVGDSYVSLADRAALSNRAPDAVFVSIHCNDGLREAANGVETYFAPDQTSGTPTIATWLPFLPKAAGVQPNLKSQSLAGFIQQELVSQTRASDRGTKAEQFYVLKNVRHPAVLVEAGFLTNKQDFGKLGDANYRERLAIAIATGILEYREAVRGGAGSVAAE